MSNDELVQKTEASEISVLDEENPRSLINLVPSEFKDPMLSLPEDFWGISEEKFEDKYGRVDVLVNRVRMGFWIENDRAVTQMRRMSLANIAHSCGLPVQNLLSLLGIVTSRNSSGGKLSPKSHNAYNFAWILIPPSTYESTLEEALSFGLARVRKDILGAPMYNSDGDFNYRAADLLLKAVAFLDMRKHGGIVQKNQSVHIHTRKDELNAISGNKSLKEIEERIAFLESKGTVTRALGLTNQDQREQDPVEHVAEKIIKEVKIKTPDEKDYEY